MKNKLTPQLRSKMRRARAFTVRYTTCCSTSFSFSGPQRKCRRARALSAAGRYCEPVLDTHPDANDFGRVKCAFRRSRPGISDRSRPPVPIEASRRAGRAASFACSFRSLRDAEPSRRPHPRQPALRALGPADGDREQGRCRQQYRRRGGRARRPREPRESIPVDFQSSEAAAKSAAASRLRSVDHSTTRVGLRATGRDTL